MMMRFNLLIAFVLAFWLSCGALAAPISYPHSLHRRSFFAWPGRLFGNDPWGLVLSPPQSVITTSSSSQDGSADSSPAANPAADPPTSIDESPVAEPPAVTPNAPVAESPSSSVPSSTLVEPSSTPTPVEPTSTSSTRHHTSTSSQSTEQPAATQDSSPAKASPPPEPSTTSSQPTESPAPSSTPAQQPANSGSVSSQSDDDIQQYLEAHNNERAQHGASPLTWSNLLASKAQEWANNCQFHHSGGSLGPFGENLAAGTGTYTIAQAVGDWNAEEPQYNPNDPQASHWTQVVWKSSTEVGCAKQQCNGIFPSASATYYVCEYSPAGNVIGDFAQNVQQ